MQPRPESRVESLEKRATAIEAGIIELSNDTAEELKAIRQDIKQLSEHVDVGFNQAHAYIDHHMAELKQDIKSIKDDMSELKSLMKQLLQQKSGE